MVGGKTTRVRRPSGRSPLKGVPNERQSAVVTVDGGGAPPRRENGVEWTLFSPGGAASGRREFYGIGNIGRDAKGEGCLNFLCSRQNR